MSKGKDSKPSNSKSTRNGDRSNGKAFKKRPGPNTMEPKAASKSGGKFGYSWKRIEGDAKKLNISTDVILSQLELQQEKRRETRRSRPARPRPAAPGTKYKMDSVRFPDEVRGHTLPRRLAKA